MGAVGAGGGGEADEDANCSQERQVFVSVEA